MNHTNAWRIGIVSIVVAAAAGCGGGGYSGATPAADTADANTGVDDFDVTSPEEATAEADSTITQENADEAFAELSAEIEAELGDG